MLRCEGNKLLGEVTRQLKKSFIRILWCFPQFNCVLIISRTAALVNIHPYKQIFYLFFYIRLFVNDYDSKSTFHMLIIKAV